MYLWNLKNQAVCREQIGGCQRQEMGMGKIGENGPKVQTSYKTNNSWGCDAQHGYYS